MAGDKLPGLVSNLVLNAIDLFEIKIIGKEAVRTEKTFPYWNSKTWNKKQECGFLPDLVAPLASSSLQPVISSLVRVISERRARRAGRRYIDKNL